MEVDQEEYLAVIDNAGFGMRVLDQSLDFEQALDFLLRNFVQGFVLRTVLRKNVKNSVVEVVSMYIHFPVLW